MTQFWLMRLAGAAVTVGGIALAVFINSEIAEKSLVHLFVTGVAAIICVFGIGIYEDASRDEPVAQDEAPADLTLSTPHVAS